MNDDDVLLYSRICTGKMFSYSVREDGIVIKTSRKHFVESKVTPYLKRDMIVVKINGRAYTLKNLVAKYHVPGYQAGDYVEVIDGNPYNCSASNLRIYTKREHGRRTGYRSSSHKVEVDGVEYRSIRECAKALHCSYQTVLDYINGATKNSVLRGINISLAN